MNVANCGRFGNSFFKIIMKKQPLKFLHSMNEPEYLKYLKPKVPVYNLLNVQMKGYDFAILEYYARYVHRTAINMGIDVENAWATPNVSKHVVTYKPFSTAVENEYDLKLYERNIQVSNIPATLTPIFIEVIHSSLPEGVNLNVHHHKEEHDEIRYIPDLELLDLKQQLCEITSPEKK